MPIRRDPHAVSRAIHARTGNVRKWVGDETLRRELWGIDVTASDAVPTNVQFPNVTRRTRLRRLVEDVRRRMRDRQPDRHGVCDSFQRGDAVATTERRIFSRSVTIDESTTRIRAEKGCGVDGRDNVSSGHEIR